MRRKFIAAPVALLTSLTLAAGPVSADEPTETPTADESTDAVADSGTDLGEPADGGPVCVLDESADESTVEPVAETSEEEPAPDPAEEPAAEELPVEPPEESTVDPEGSDVIDMLESAEIAAEAALELDGETKEEEEEAEEAEAEEEEDASAPELDRAKVSLEAAYQRLCQPGAGGNGVAALVLAALIRGDSPAGIGAAHGKAMAAAAADRRAERHDEREKTERGRPDHAGPRIDTVPEVEEEVETVEDGELGDVEQLEETAAETEVVVQAEDVGRPDHAGGPKSDGKVADTSDKSAGKSGGRPVDAGNGKGKGRP